MQYLIVKPYKILKAKLGIIPVIQNLKIKTLKIKKLKTVIGENRSAFLDFS